MTDYELLTEVDRLRKIERILRAIVAYNTDGTLAEHLVIAMDGGETNSDGGVVRKVWVNHKLVASFRVLRQELEL